MKIQNYKSPSIRETPSVPDDVNWIDAYMEPRDKSGKTLVQALQKQLSLGDNFNAELRNLRVRNDTDTIVTLQTLRGNPTGAQIFSSSLYDYPRLKWEIIDTRRIRFAVKWDSAPTDPVDVLLVVWGN